MEEVNQAHHRAGKGTDYWLVTLLDKEAWLLGVAEPVPTRVLVELARVYREIAEWESNA